MVLLLTGASGFVGRKVLEKLAKNGIKVVGISRTSRAKGIKAMDLAKDFDLPGNFSGTFHLAGKNHLQGKETPLEYFKANLNTTINVLEFCRKKDIERIVFSSSLSVYGKKFFGTITEQTVPQPDSAYALSKWFAEQAIELYHQLYRIKYSILRYSTVFGPNQGDNAVSAFKEKCRRNLDIEIERDSFRNFVFVEDVAAATVSAMEIKGNEIFNIASAENVSLSQLANAVKAALGSNSHIYVKGPAKNEFKIDISKAEKHLGFKESVPFDGRIKDAVLY